MRRFLCLLDSQPWPGDRWLWNYLPERDDQVDFAVARPPDLFGGLGKALTRYPGYFLTARQALRMARRAEYDAIVAWESKNGLPLACLRWLRDESRPPLVLLTFSAKPNALRLAGLLRRWLRYVDHVTVPSTWEAAYYGKALGLAAGQVSVCHLGAYDLRAELPAGGAAAGGAAATPYLFSGGRTDRDYRTLLEAVAGSGVRTVIAARPYALRGLRLPAEVEVNDLLSIKAYVVALAQAQAAVVPLAQVNHAAGLSLVLDAMALGRPVICSDIPAVRDYIADGVTGVLAPPGDAAALRDAIAAVAGDRAYAEALGRAARARYEEQFTFAAFARRVYGVLERAVEGGH